MLSPDGRRRVNLAELRQLVDDARPRRRALVVDPADRPRVERALERLRGQGYDVDALELRSPMIPLGPGRAYVIDLDAPRRLSVDFDLG